ARHGGLAARRLQVVAVLRFRSSACSRRLALSETDGAGGATLGERAAVPEANTSGAPGTVPRSWLCSGSRRSARRGTRASKGEDAWHSHTSNRSCDGSLLVCRIR